MPTDLHPAVWRASDTAPPPSQTVSTKHAALDTWLPGRGWPLATLIEVLHPAPGCGEIELVAPALANLPADLPIVLLQPPLIPNALAWQQWKVDSHRLWWVQAQAQRDAWWCAEQILRSRSFAALLCWGDGIDGNILRRLQWCAQDSSTLVFLFRPLHAALQPSPATLRVQVMPDGNSHWQLELLKCRGPKPPSPLVLPSAHAAALPTHCHGPVDRIAPDLARA